MKKLMEGFARFQAEVFPEKRHLFESLKSEQNPRALFITCADSRVVPDLITQASPGDLFICRNAGNIVPPYGETQGGVSATIEYAVRALNVPHIIICGHSDCGAMKGILMPETVVELPVVSHWLGHAETARRMVLETHPQSDLKTQLQLVTYENVLAQLDNLKTHPSVAIALARGQLRIYGWVYEIDTGRIQSFNADRGRFELLTGENMPHATPYPRRLDLVENVI